jgi:hypothetical protein
LKGIDYYCITMVNKNGEQKFQVITILYISNSYAVNLCVKLLLQFST